MSSDMYRKEIAPVNCITLSQTCCNLQKFHRKKNHFIINMTARKRLEK